MWSAGNLCGNEMKRKKKPLVKNMQTIRGTHMSHVSNARLYGKHIIWGYENGCRPTFGYWPRFMRFPRKPTAQLFPHMYVSVDACAFRNANEQWRTDRELPWSSGTLRARIHFIETSTGMPATEFNVRSVVPWSENRLLLDFVIQTSSLATVRNGKICIGANTPHCVHHQGVRASMG